ncbi:MAG: methyltransferase [Candidatus Bathyarchaeota archaeon]
MKSRYRVSFPAIEPHKLAQDEAFYYLEENGKELKLRFHEYDELYRRPGLYEQLFYDRLKCTSPQKIIELLYSTIGTSQPPFSELRVLDLGAGNGMVGERLSEYGVARLVGFDISEIAYKALERDRPGIYDAYYVADLTNLSEDVRRELTSWRLNCLVSVAALGFGDIPVPAFIEAFNLVEDGGWIAFNIKETFMDYRDTSGFSVFAKNLILTEHLDIYHMERYQHRLSIDGRPLYYFSLAGKKNSSIPSNFLNKIQK